VKDIVTIDVTITNKLDLKQMTFRYFKYL
jgi:hypothetical protein